MWIADWERERLACPVCGGSREDCSDHDTVWYPRRDVCYRAAAQAAAQRLLEAAHEEMPYHDGTRTSWAKEFSPEHPNHYGDGVTVWVATEPGGEWP